MAVAKKQKYEHIARQSSPTPVPPSSPGPSDSMDIPDIESQAFPEPPDSSAEPPPSYPSKKARVEDVPDEDDDIPGSARWVEDFPFLAGDPIVWCGTREMLFETYRPEKLAQGEDMWQPFESHKEWELAHWLVRSGISQKEIDNFLKLASVSVLVYARYWTAVLILLCRSRKMLRWLLIRNINYSRPLIAFQPVQNGSVRSLR